MSKALCVTCSEGDQGLRCEREQELRNSNMCYCCNASKENRCQWWDTFKEELTWFSLYVALHYHSCKKTLILLQVYILAL